MAHLKKRTENITKVLRELKKYHGGTMLGGMSTTEDPWKVLISTILSTRARDEVTGVVAEELFRKYPNVKALAGAGNQDVEKLIRRIGFYRVKARNIIEVSRILLRNHGGLVPDTIDELVKLPGVGRKVAGCVLVFAYNKSAIPVDTHVHRISNRLGWVESNTPDKTEIELMKIIPKRYWIDVNDLLVYHGKTVCKPITPNCEECIVERWCDKVGN